MLFVIPPDKRAGVMKALSDYRVEEVKVDPFGSEGGLRGGLPKWRRKGRRKTRWREGEKVVTENPVTPGVKGAKMP